jgi:hypothetical protein
MLNDDKDNLVKRDLRKSIKLMGALSCNQSGAHLAKTPKMYRLGPVMEDSIETLLYLPGTILVT